MPVAAERHQLRRVLGLWALTIYAVGDILGAGIYALVGKVAGVAGSDAWLSFIVSACLAALTGLTYAEFSSRYPLAGGAAAYCRRALGRRMAFFVGIFVLASGITSAATVARAFVGYLEVFVQVPDLAASLGLLVAISLVNHAGIRESSRVNLALTGVEVGGLLLVIGAGIYALPKVPVSELTTRLSPAWDLPAILAGATVAFYSYIGFEDTANVAEEVRAPQRTLPWGILLAIGLTCLLYTGVSLIVLAVMPLERLAASSAPLLEVLSVAGLTVPPTLFATIALFAVGNTGLLNLVMASRLLYGMAREGLLPAVFARVDPVRRTPFVAIWLAFALAALLTASGEVRLLAQTTTLLLLWIFTLLHVGLLLIHRRESRPADIFWTPNWVPLLGAPACLFLATQYPVEVYLRAGGVLLVAAGLYCLVSRRRLS